MAVDTPAHFLAALAVPEVGPARLRTLLDAFGSVQAAVRASPHQLAEVEGVPPRVWAAFGRHASAAMPEAERVVREAREAGLTVSCWSDDDYPAPLRADPSGCAPVLFVEGALPPAVMLPYPRVRAVGVVGTRRPTSVAAGLARDLGRNLARVGIVVVSGLAYGIDAAAHRGALEGAAESALAARRVDVEQARHADARSEGPWPGCTVAVLGGGHDLLYPAAHRPLAREIVRAGGAIVSEWPPHVRAQPHHFLQRNRVISALSRAVVVVQAGERSGALNTATHAGEQGRTVMVVPALPGDAKYAGNLALLRDGAVPVIDESDVLVHFPELHAVLPAPDPPQRDDAEGSALGGGPGSPMDASPRQHGVPGLEGAGGGEPATTATATTLVRSVLEGRTELAIDELIVLSGLSATEVLGALTRLELAGEAMRNPDGRYRRRTRARPSNRRPA